MKLFMAVICDHKNNDSSNASDVILTNVNQRKDEEPFQGDDDSSNASDVVLADDNEDKNEQFRSDNNKIEKDAEVKKLPNNSKALQKSKTNLHASECISNPENISNLDSTFATKAINSEKHLHSSKDEQGAFIPTTEWKQIPEGESVPRGTFCRMDMKTGINYAIKIPTRPFCVDDIDGAEEKITTDENSSCDSSEDDNENKNDDDDDVDDDDEDDADDNDGDDGNGDDDHDHDLDEDDADDSDDADDNDDGNGDDDDDDDDDDHDDDNDDDYDDDGGSVGCGSGVNDEDNQVKGNTDEKTEEIDNDNVTVSSSKIDERIDDKRILIEETSDRSKTTPKTSDNVKKNLMENASYTSKHVTKDKVKKTLTKTASSKSKYVTNVNGKSSTEAFLLSNGTLVADRALAQEIEDDIESTDDSVGCSGSNSDSDNSIIFEKYNQEFASFIDSKKDEIINFVLNTANFPWNRFSERSVWFEKCSSVIEFCKLAVRENYIFQAKCEKEFGIYLEEYVNHILFNVLTITKPKDINDIFAPYGQLKIEIKRKHCGSKYSDYAKYIILPEVLTAYIAAKRNISFKDATWFLYEGRPPTVYHLPMLNEDRKVIYQKKIPAMKMEVVLLQVVKTTVENEFSHLVVCFSATGQLEDFVSVENAKEDTVLRTADSREYPCRILLLPKDEHERSLQKVISEALIIASDNNFQSVAFQGLPIKEAESIIEHEVRSLNTNICIVRLLVDE